LLSVALLATVVANASKIVTVSSPGAKVVNITLADVSQGETLSIIDTNGKKLLNETLNQADSFVKTINFSPLKDGIYFLETRKEKEVNVTPIVINSSSVNVMSNITKTYSAPKITTEGTIARILVKNFDKSAVTVSIFDEQSGQEIKLEDSTDLLIYRSFDFERLGSGTYTISVTQNDYNFTEVVKF